VTMSVTPSLMTLAPHLAARFRSRTRPAADAEAAGHRPQETGHVIIMGYGVGGQLVARALKDLHTPYMILELNGATVRRARADGQRIMYGDATSPESLEGLHVDRAAAIVSLVSDPDAARRMVKAVRSISETIPVIVRTRYRLEAEELIELGATVAVAEELETSLEVLTQLLARLQVPGNVTDMLLDVYRRQSAGMRPLRAHRPRFDALPDAIRAMPVATHRVGEEEWAAGRSVAEINLRAATGASILAVQSGERFTRSPPSDWVIKAGDVLYLTGDDSDITLGRERLRSGGGVSAQP
jgi:monovalent cation:H+ antiporter-2, CPA2 family